MLIEKIKTKLINFSHYIGNNAYLNPIDMRSIKYKKKLYIMTSVWGDYLDYYFNYSLPSILCNSNIGALEREGFEVKIVIYSLDKDYLINKYMDDLPIDANQIEIIQFDSGTETEARKIACLPLINMFKKCLDEDAFFFILPPDTILGRGSFFNCVMSSYGKNTCFASAHPRVDLNILNVLERKTEEGMNNSDLVRLAFRFPHGSFKFANEDLENNTTHKGISYRQISTTLHTVTHNLPSPYLIFPIDSDYEYFNRVADYNMFDREWLEALIKTNRIKISGSSDLFFNIELTPASFIPEEEIINNVKYNDSSGDQFHHRVCRTFSSVWRSSLE